MFLRSEDLGALAAGSLPLIEVSLRGDSSAPIRLFTSRNVGPGYFSSLSIIGKEASGGLGLLPA
jgi:hypothetical protein